MSLCGNLQAGSEWPQELANFGSGDTAFWKWFPFLGLLSERLWARPLFITRHV